MNISVEFAGLARIVTGIPTTSLNLNQPITFRELIHTLSEQYPDLVGTVIQPDGETLYASNMFNLNGARMIQPHQMDEHPQDGDRVIVMSVLAGG